MLVLFLRKSDGISEFHMELVEVSDVLVCTSRNKIIFRMDGDGRVIAFVGKERRYSEFKEKEVAKLIFELAKYIQQTGVFI